MSESIQEIIIPGANAERYKIGRNKYSKEVISGLKETPGDESGEIDLNDRKLIKDIEKAPTFRQGKGKTSEMFNYAEMKMVAPKLSEKSWLTRNDIMRALLLTRPVVSRTGRPHSSPASSQSRITHSVSKMIYSSKKEEEYRIDDFEYAIALSLRRGYSSTSARYTAFRDSRRRNA